jgi:hypothetical protein
MILHVLFAMLAGWIQRHQQRVITSVHKENGFLKAQLRGRRVRALMREWSHLTNGVVEWAVYVSSRLFHEHTWDICE